MLSAEEKQAVERALAHAEGDGRRAAIDALAAVQRSRGWLSDETLADVGAALDVTVHELDSVATFYNHLFRRPVGRHVIRICDSIACHLTGQESILAALERRLGIRLGETTPDGRFTLITIPCLGACDRAPAMMIDERLFGDLTEEKLDAILGEFAS